MPMTFIGVPLISMFVPSTRGSPPKACCRSAWLRTAMRSLPAASSPSENVRPISASAPSTEKKVAEVSTSFTREAPVRWPRLASITS